MIVMVTFLAGKEQKEEQLPICQVLCQCLDYTQPFQLSRLYIIIPTLKIRKLRSRASLSAVTME